MFINVPSPSHDLFYFSPEGLVMDVYEESVPMSTYLACFIVCDFKNISRMTPSGILVSLAITY